MADLQKQAEMASEEKEKSSKLGDQLFGIPKIFVSGLSLTHN